MMEAGAFEAACPKLAESHRLDPATGTLLALALCHEAQQKTASAWAEFNAVAELASRERRTDRARLAQQRAALLRPRLAYVTVRLAIKLEQLPDVTITVDGVPLGRPAWNVAIPVDPGRHTLGIRAPGMLDGTIAMEAMPGESVVVAVPPLVPKVESKPTPNAVPSEVTERPAPPQRHLVPGAAWVAAAIGVASLGAAGYFGLSAIGSSDEADSLCPTDRCFEPRAVSLSKDARRSALVADVLIGAGLASLAASLVIVLTSRSSPVSVTVGSTSSLGASVGVARRF